MSRLKRWGKELVVLVLLVAVVSLGMDWLRSPQAPSDWSSTPLQTLTGETVSLQAMSQDKPLLIYFWATWCAVCKFTSPSVNQLVQEGENVMTVALRSGDGPQVEHWLRKKGYQMPVINDATGQLSAQWQVSVTPTLVVLYRGKMVQHTSGWTSYWGMKARLWLAAF
ncbi:protein disulfide oxidoreductase [Yersinia massiliensis]|mgnify:FL=1|uniref:Protein disulfide oxidoreductase n=1 Tax=Yersinia massiliensis TaxID=419257 RepID=A0A2R4NMT0_9GAMM|nr:MULTISPECIES: protein disulfide oxidoreductase [Yersinia]HEC1650087.1 protein disulfide oxidoreductase [Yersinia enterocolitica]AVX37432.1 protein disulfide oxidoreductase [Yersinia massiliensis]MDA5546311.1 protein disulfide oxidoreductase [Yersinia massiliensis]NIL27219.1 protein disulfide oxidoreductase [Yersinia massiliensis]OWF75165.1 protein disulfide oxidoreductase [Yersinia frederiksenii]